MNDIKIWRMREVFIEGVLHFNDIFNGIDRKAQFWMGVSLTGLLALTSYFFEKEGLNLSFIMLVCSCWPCFFLAIVYLAKTLLLKRVATGFRSMEGTEEAIKSELESEEGWEKFAWAHAEFSLTSFKDYLIVNDEKSSSLAKAEGLLFFGVLGCSCFSLIAAPLMRCISGRVFDLPGILAGISTDILVGTLSGIIGIIICIFIIRHVSEPS